MTHAQGHEQRMSVNPLVRFPARNARPLGRPSEPGWSTGQGCPAWPTVRAGVSSASRSLQGSGLRGALGQRQEGEEK